MTPQNQLSSPRVLARGTRSRRALQVGVAGVAVLAASVAVPAALGQNDGVEAFASAVIATTTSVVPTSLAPTTLPSTTVAPATTTTTAAPAPVIEVAPEPVPPTPEELAQAKLAAATPGERLAFQLYVMTNAERAAFSAYISPPPPPPPAPAPAPVEEYVVTYEEAPSAEAPPVANGDVWDRLAQCEANGNWHINTGNGYSGGLQFHPNTWLANGGGQYASQAYLASREQQIAVAENLLAASGGRFSPWPGCRAKLGLA